MQVLCSHNGSHIMTFDEKTNKIDVTSDSYRKLFKDVGIPVPSYMQKLTNDASKIKLGKVDNKTFLTIIDALYIKTNKLRWTTLK